MKLQTKLPLHKNASGSIHYESKVLLLGSCFSEHIGDKFDYYKFQGLSNTFGILFHPLAIENFVTKAINKDVYAEEDVFQLNEQWHCYDAHSRLSHPSKSDLLEQLNDQIDKTHQFLVSASHVIITLGTAWAYRLIETDAYVANCHKVPQKKFLKELLSVATISESLDAITSMISSINPNVRFIFTVSPVRHLKDGFIENTQSKAHLISAIHDFLNGSPSIKHSASYFPSYEIMMDELRDYRFYKEDMLHPNTTAIDYIWERFQEVYISEDTTDVMESVATIQKGLAHRPVNPISAAHQTFLAQLKKKQEALTAQFPHIQF